MKLAEALIERKALLEKVGSLEARIHSVCTFQEGAEPSEDATKLMRESEGAYSAYGELIMRINRTNTHAWIDAGNIQTTPVATVAGTLLSDLIVLRDVAISHQACLKRVAQVTRNNLSNARRTQSEIRTVTKVDLAKLEHEIAQLGEKARKLDAQLQGANWNIDLM